MTDEKDRYQNPRKVPEEWNLLQRINWVRAQLSYIQKEKEVKVGGTVQYKAVTHDAVTANIRPLLIEAGIDVSQTLESSQVVDSGSTTKNGVPIIRYEATYLITFANIDKPEEKETVRIEAHALDQGDKAPGKAMSYGQKYPLLKRFLLETGEDEESRVEQKAAADMEAEKEAFRMEQLNAAVAQHMDTITTVKTSIRDAGITLDKKSHQITHIENEALLEPGIEAWAEMTNDEKRSIWVAPSKGGPFSTDERYILKSDKFSALTRKFLGQES